MKNNPYKWLFVSFLILFCAAMASAVTLFIRYDRSTTESRHIEENDFYNLASGIENMDTAFQKGLVSTSPVMLASVAGEITEEASTVSALLSRLPITNEGESLSAKLINQSGDFARYLVKQTAAGCEMTADERQYFTDLAALCARLSTEMGELRQAIESGQSIAEALQNSRAFLPSDGTEAGFYSPSDEFPEFPSLIYDGPFSKHLTDRSPAYAAEFAEVTQDMAAKNFAEMLGIEQAELELDSETSGELPCYCYRYGDCYLSLAKAGGVPVSMFCSVAPSAIRISYDAALSSATDLLERLGYNPVEQSYFVKANNCFVINFAYTQDGVTVYPDLIKVTVAGDSGKVVGFDATGWVYHHVERDLDTPAISVEDGYNCIPEGMTVLSEGMAVIPTAGENEKYCYEYKCEQNDGSHVLIYVDAVSGCQADVILLVEDENGTLAL